MRDHLNKNCNRLNKIFFRMAFGSQISLCHIQVKGVHMAFRRAISAGHLPGEERNYFWFPVGSWLYQALLFRACSYIRKSQLLF